MRDPDLRGGYGTAWNRRSPPATNAQKAGLLDTWYLDFVPPIVGARQWFAINVISLRSGAAVLAYPEAKYELQMVPVRKYTDPDGPGWIAEGPPELVAQFNGDVLGDQAAKAICRLVAEAAIKGGLPPKRFAVNGWRELLGRLMARLNVTGKVVWA